jgi:hypothetical protein
VGIVEQSRICFLYDFLLDLENQKSLAPFFEAVTKEGRG